MFVYLYIFIKKEEEEEACKQYWKSICLGLNFCVTWLPLYKDLTGGHITSKSLF